MGAKFLHPGLLLNWARELERKAAGLEERRVLVGRHEIAYLEGGKGEPVLLVHGFAANKDTWTRFARSISPLHRVLALDLPGFGESTFFEYVLYGIAEQAERLKRFTEALGLEKYHIVGNSMGGHIAARHTVMFPERVLTLALFDSAGVQCPIPSEMERRMYTGEPNPLLAGGAGEFDRMIRLVFSVPPYIPKMVKRLLVEEARRHKLSNEIISNQLAAETEALTPDLPKIKAPTLVLWGDRDRVVDVSCVEVFRRGLPSCTAVIMKDCGHMPMLERPQDTAAHYEEFLRRMRETF